MGSRNKNPHELIGQLAVHIQLRTTKDPISSEVDEVQCENRHPKLSSDMNAHAVMHVYPHPHTHKLAHTYMHITHEHTVHTDAF